MNKRPLAKVLGVPVAENCRGGRVEGDVALQVLFLRAGGRGQ